MLGERVELRRACVFGTWRELPAIVDARWGATLDSALSCPPNRLPSTGLRCLLSLRVTVVGSGGCIFKADVD